MLFKTQALTMSKPPNLHSILITWTPRKITGSACWHFRPAEAEEVAATKSLHPPGVYCSCPMGELDLSPGPDGEQLRSMALLEFYL